MKTARNSHSQFGHAYDCIIVKLTSLFPVVTELLKISLSYYESRVMVLTHCQITGASVYVTAPLQDKLIIKLPLDLL